MDEGEMEIEQMHVVGMAERGDSNPRVTITVMNKKTATPLIIFVFWLRFAQR